MTKTFPIVAAWLLCVLTAGGALFAQPAATGPASAPVDQALGSAAEPGRPVEITITGIEGLVQVRAAEDQPWKKAQLGMHLDEGAEFRTGPRSAVRFVIAPDQVITLDRLGTVKVIHAIRSATMVKTDLGMKYGRTRYDIEAAGLDHQSTIRSPSATLAIRGTKVSLEDSLPFPAIARSLTGSAELGKGKSKQKFGGKQYTQVDGDKNNAAETELDGSAADPGSWQGRDDTEQGLVDTFVSGAFDQSNLGFGADFRGLDNSGSPISGLTHGGGGTPPAPEVGHLNFFVSWTGPGDLDMFVVDPTGFATAVYTPGGVPIAHTGGPAISSPSGSSIVRDVTSANGVEQINWLTTHPTGTYNVGTRVFSTSGPNSVRIEGFLDGVRIGSVFTANLNQTGNYTFTPITVSH